MFDCIHGLTPHYLSNNVTTVVDIHGYNRRSSENMDLYVPRRTKELCKRSLSYAGRMLWNDLPDILKESSSHDVFKRNYRFIMHWLTHLPSRHITQWWRRCYIKTMLFWRNYVKMASFWRNNDVIITSCVQGVWVYNVGILICWFMPYFNPSHTCMMFLHFTEAPKYLKSLYGFTKL